MSLSARFGTRLWGYLASSDASSALDWDSRAYNRGRPGNQIKRSGTPNNCTRELWAGAGPPAEDCHVYERETCESMYRKVTMHTDRWVAGTWNDREIYQSTRGNQVESALHLVREVQQKGGRQIHLQSAVSCIH
jgi:hypothetical protein